MEELKTRLISVVGKKFLGFLFISAMVITCSAVPPLREFYKFTMGIWLTAFGIFCGGSVVQKYIFAKNGK